jgi:hypothetical protein
VDRLRRLLFPQPAPEPVAVARPVLDWPAPERTPPHDHVWTDGPVDVRGAWWVLACRVPDCDGRRYTIGGRR